MKLKNKVKKIFTGITILLLVLLSVCIFYLNDYYQADLTAISAFSSRSQIQAVQKDGILCFYPETKTHTGLIFYPGGKVEHTAYTPLMKELAQHGILCILVEMPFHLAVFIPDAAEGIPAQFPEINNWYLSGHSLGGAMASSYLSQHRTAFQGLILLGAYSTNDLSESGLSVLSVYGSEDLVLNRETYEKNRSNLPENFTETVLEGGCHAGFGMYGPQEGDGFPVLSTSEQIIQTAKLMSSFILQQTSEIP